MLKFGSLREAQTQSAIEGLATLRPKNKDRSLLETAAPLMLTSLVDAFAVIVIYLLVSTHQGNKEIDLEQKIQLPTAEASQTIEPGISVSVLEGAYFFEDQELSIGELLTVLQEKAEALKADESPKMGRIIIQADKNSDYKLISPLLSVASQSGFDDIHFATVGSSL